MSRYIPATPQPPRRSLAHKLLPLTLVLGAAGYLTWMFADLESNKIRIDQGALSPTVVSRDLPFEDPKVLIQTQTHRVPRSPSSPNPPQPVQVARATSESHTPVIIAIIDTGLDIQNPLFQKYLWHHPRSAFEHGWNYNHNSADISDEHGHGTHVAGIIVHQLEYLRQLTPTARPIQLMILKYFDPQASGQQNLQNSLKAFRYAIDNGAKIINYSGGGASPSREEEELVLRASAEGVIIVAAAGNEGENADLHPFYPANYAAPNVISVGALDLNQAPLASTNYGRRNVDLMTVGQKIASTLPGGRNGMMTGTSQATAFVTAALAQLLASRSENMNFIAAIDQILTSGRPSQILGQITRSGSQLDAKKAISSRTSHQIFSDQALLNSDDSVDVMFAAEPEALNRW